MLQQPVAQRFSVVLVCASLSSLFVWREYVPELLAQVLLACLLLVNLPLMGLA